MLRQAVKTAGAWALHATGGDRLIGAARGVAREPLVLCYHRVVHDTARHPSSAPAMLVSKRTLAAQLDWIARRYRFVELDELARSVEEGVVHQRPIAAVTFDDGYADVYRNAMPVLRRKGIPWAIFVVTDLIGTRRLLVHDRLHVMLREANRRFGAAGVLSLLDRHQLERPRCRAEGPWPPMRVTRMVERMLATLPRPTLDGLVADLERYVIIPPEVADRMRPLDWAMLAEMKAAGVTVGSHTKTHRVLPNESAEDIALELVVSKRTLEEKLGGRVDHFSFPNGYFSPVTVRAVRAAGYRYAYTCCFHRDPDHQELTIPRRTFWERSISGARSPVSPAIASCHVNGVFDTASGCLHADDAPPSWISSSRVAPPHLRPPMGQPLRPTQPWASPSNHE